MTIYLAARYSRRAELVAYRALLEALGHTVTSRWLHGNHQIDDDGLEGDGTRAERERFAQEDYEDVCRAELLIAFTEPPRTGPTRGGRHVEFGIAIALEKRVLVVGPRENGIYCLPWVAVYATAAEAFRTLAPAPKAA